MMYGVVTVRLSAEGPGFWVYPTGHSRSTLTSLRSPNPKPTTNPIFEYRRFRLRVP